MDNEGALAEKLYQVASFGFFLAALLFFVAAGIGRNTIYSLIGVAFVCLGALFIFLSIQKGNENNSGK